MSTWTGRATIVTEEFERHRRPPTEEEAEARAISARKLWTGILGMHWVLFLLVSLAGFNQALAVALFSSAYIHSVVYLCTFGWVEALISSYLPVTRQRKLWLTRVIPVQLLLAEDASLQVFWRRREAIEVDRSVADLNTAGRADLPGDMMLDLDRAIFHVARNQDRCVLLELRDPDSTRAVHIAVDSRVHLPLETLDELPLIERQSLQLDAPDGFFRDLTAFAEAIGALPPASLQTLRAFESD